jgi:hypothetical protein
MPGRKQRMRRLANHPQKVVHLYRLQAVSGSRFVKLTNQILAGSVSLVFVPRDATGSHSTTSED